MLTEGSGQDARTPFSPTSFGGFLSFLSRGKRENPRNEVCTGKTAKPRLLSFFYY